MSADLVTVAYSGVADRLVLDGAWITEGHDRRSLYRGNHYSVRCGTGYRVSVSLPRDEMTELLYWMQSHVDVVEGMTAAERGDSSELRAARGAVAAIEGALK